MISISSDDFVEVLEYNKGHISFEADGESCHTGHLVKVNGIIYLPEGPHPVVSLGKVAKSVRQSDGKLTVTIELRSYDQQIWRRFTSFLSERQNQLDTLFNQLRDAE